MTFLSSATTYTNKGISVIPTDAQKRSIVSWKEYQKRIATAPELERLFSHHKCQGIAVICGAVSGNLEVIDVDCKYGVKWEDYADKIISADPQLYERLMIIKTKSDGYHIYYRCEVIEGNQKLAERPATDDELHDNPNVKQCVLIETRGEGGYVIAPPSNGYTAIQLMDEIPVITIDERDLLHSIAREFNTIIEQARQPIIPHNNDNVTTWDDYNKRGDIIALLEKHGWTKTNEYDNKSYWLRPGSTSSAHSAVLFNDTRIFYIHTTSTQFENKGYNPFGVYTVLECNGDHRKAAKQLSSVYGQKNTSGWFWTYTKSGAVVINKYKLQQWLHANNFQLYFLNEKNGIYRLIHEDNKIVSEVYPQVIKQFIKTKLIDNGHEDVMEAIIKQTTSIFTDSFFEYIDKSDISILRDEPHKCYFPFKNGIVTITKDSVDLVKYGDIPNSIWIKQVKEFDIEINQNFAPDDCEFYRFICKISGDDESRVFYALSLIGYILHGYKDPSKPYAPILAEETDDEAKGGGTGKGIFFKAIDKLIPCIFIDGKNFKPDKTFAFQRVDLGTKLVVIEDCPKNVEFERYYPTITEGMTIEKKNQDELFLGYAESPKLSFTTNYSIANNAEHAKRRQKVLEFAPFFSSKYTPFDYFGHKLFDDWNHDEWQKFYNLLFFCVSFYLEHGIKSVDNSEKLKRKQLKQQFGEDFLDYLDSFITDDLNTFKGMSEEWKNFLNIYELDKKEYSLKRFKKGLQIGSQLLDIDYIEVKNRQNNNLKEFKLVKKDKTCPNVVTDVIDL
jgi:hypothetical protein